MPPRPLRRAATLLLLCALLASVTAGVWRICSAARAIRRLARGADESLFLSAEGTPWFPLDERRRPVPLAQTAPVLRQAVVAIEDRRFYRHPGLDPVAIGRALVRNLRGGRIAEGGSTITQQLARTLFLSRRRTWERKVREAAYALLLEALLSKEKILELYLNRVPLGGVSGVEAFALERFGKHAADLSLAESALLAGIIQAPTALSPAAHFDRALARSRVVLARLRQDGLISAEEERRALRERPRIIAETRRAAPRSGYAREYLRASFREQFGEDSPAGWRIRTSFRIDLQRAAEEEVARGLGRLGIDGLQAALVALDPETGDVLALVGGADFAASAYNRALFARRQPGSAFKPFVYAAALERGLSPISRLAEGESASFREERSPWMAAADPEAGGLTLREALSTSDNEAALLLQQQVGTAAVLAMAERAGLPTQPAVPSLALGTGSATPLQLTAAYAIFANGGYFVPPRAILKVQDEGGAAVFEESEERRRVLAAPVAFQMVTLLRDVIERGTGSGAADPAFPLAGKTGTTDDYRDAWFVGFSSRVVTGVWVGFDHPAPIRDEGYAARVALPIWSAFMRRAAVTLPPGTFEPSPGMSAVELCRISYRLPLEGCPTYLEYLKEGDELPELSCPLHGGTLRQRVVRVVGNLIDRIRALLR